MNIKSIKFHARLNHSEKYIVHVERWENTLDNKRAVLNAIDLHHFGGAVYVIGHDGDITILECVVYTD